MPELDASAINCNVPATVTVPAATLQSIAVTPAAPTVSIGGTQQFNPLSAIPMNGWFHQECYDQANNFAFSFDTYSLIRITGGMASKEGGLVKPQFEINMLYSTLNTGAAS